MYNGPIALKKKIMCLKNLVSNTSVGFTAVKNLKVVSKCVWI